MNAEEFVVALRMVVRDSTVRDVATMLDHPPGRSPAPNLIEMSGWYRNLSAADKAMVHRVVGYTADSAVFGVLCVLDGVRVIEDPQARGELVLDHLGPTGRTRLNDVETTLLHELW